MLKDIKDGSCRFYYAHENITLLERYEHVAFAEDFTKFKNLLNNTDVIESCTRKGAVIKWKFYKLTNVTVCASLLKEVPIGCKDTVLSDPLFRNQSVKCLTFEEISWKPYN